MLLLMICVPKGMLLMTVATTNRVNVLAISTYGGSMMARFTDQSGNCGNGGEGDVRSRQNTKTGGFFRALVVAALMHASLVSAGVAAEVPLRVGYTSITGNRIPFWIAKEVKLFEKYDLNAELIYIQSAAIGVPALISGDFQILAGGVASALQAISKGSKLVLLGTFGATPYILFTRPEIKEISQLKGAIIGVNRIGASDYYALRRLLQKVELSPDRDVRIIPAGAPLDRFVAIQKRLIDATLGSDSGLARNPIRVNRLVELTKAGVEDHGSALLTTQNYADSKSGVLDRFARAFTEAIAVSRRNKELTKRVYSKFLRTNDDALLELNYQTYVLGVIPKVPVFPVDALQNILNDLAEESPAIRKLDIKAILRNSFIQRLDDGEFIDRLYR
jgi:ABC-type nitrate/sulfonate/bicarbonate transport system substrate-binding protein